MDQFPLLQAPSEMNQTIGNVVLIGFALILVYTLTSWFLRSKFTKVIDSLKAQIGEDKLKIQDQLLQLEDYKKDILLKNERIDLMEEEFNNLQVENQKLNNIYEASKELYLKAANELESINDKIRQKDSQVKE